MSQFKTQIPVNLQAVLDLLPAGSFVEGIDWGPDAVYVRWSHHELVTPWTFHADAPLDRLKAKKLPEGATIKRWPKTEPLHLAAAVSSTQQKVLDSAKKRVHKSGRVSNETVV